MWAHCLLMNSLTLRSILVDHGMEGGPVVLRAEGGVLSNNFNRTLWFLLNYLLFL